MRYGRGRISVATLVVTASCEGRTDGAREEPAEVAIELDASPDLLVSCRAGSGWDEPRRLPAPIDSPYREFAPGFSSEHLYFTSKRPGIVGAQPDSLRPPRDIYRTPLSAVRRVCEPGG